MVLLRDTANSLSTADIKELVDKTQGYSGADIRSVCTEAAMGPVREVCARGVNLSLIQAREMPSIGKHHFDDALESVAPSVSESDLKRYIDWNGIFGTYRKMEGL
jgi:SpoVK/Ycf46/Vps4 family AAA+-type ATPase